MKIHEYQAKQLLREAGVTVNIKREAANAYFDTNLLYTKLPFAQSFWTYSSLAAWYTQAVLSDAVWNETHFREKAYDGLIQDAIGATDESSAQDLWDQVQQRQLDEGGYIVWAYQNIVDAAAPNVGGITPSSFFSLMIRSLIESARIGSRPVVGSSYRVNSGSNAIARARATRLRCPPDRSAGRLFCTPSSPTIASFFLTISSISSSECCVCSMRGNATFCPAVSESKSAPI